MSSEIPVLWHDDLSEEEYQAAIRNPDCIVIGPNMCWIGGAFWPTDLVLVMLEGKLRKEEEDHG